MSAAGETITVTVRCKAFTNGEESVQLPSTTTVLELKEFYAQKYGLNLVELRVIAKGSRILKDAEVLSESSSDPKHVTVTLNLKAEQ
jgi:hypothetical protein